MRWLKTQRDVYSWKVVGTVYGRNGIPDICGSVGAVVLFLEVKRENGRVSERQAAEHRRIRKAGGFVWIVRSLEEAQSAVRALREHAERGSARTDPSDEKISF